VPDHPGQPRGHHGKYDRSPDTAVKQAEAMELRGLGHSYQAIATEMGITKSYAHELVTGGLAATIAEPAEQLRTLELQRLDDELLRLAGLEATVHKVLEKKHLVVSHGQIVRKDGEPLEDDAPALAAIDRLLRIDEQRRRNGVERRKLLGLDAAQKVEQQVDLSGGLRYEIVGVDPAELT
jgi:hypothetical protein